MTPKENKRLSVVWGQLVKHNSQCFSFLESLSHSVYDKTLKILLSCGNKQRKNQKSFWLNAEDIHFNIHMQQLQQLTHPLSHLWYHRFPCWVSSPHSVGLHLLPSLERKHKDFNYISFHSFVISGQIRLEERNVTVPTDSLRSVL